MSSQCAYPKIIWWFPDTCGAIWWLYAALLLASVPQAFVLLKQIESPTGNMGKTNLGGYYFSGGVAG